jgi:flagellar motor switch protein FliM
MSEQQDESMDAVDDGVADAVEQPGAAASVLSDEELEALRGTAAGSDHDDDDGDGEGEGCSLYDFRDPSRTLNGRLPGLESVHETFCNGMQQVLRQLIGRTVEVSAGETTLTRLGDYQKSLPFPTSLHSVMVEERKHPMSLCADGTFVYTCVDAFFGGVSAGGAPLSEREFSTSERRFMQMLAEQAFRELEAAWAPICELRFGEPKGMKAGGLGNGRDDQIMVVSRFQVGLNPGHGDFHVVMPYALLDALRPYLTAGPRGAETSRNWRRRFVDKLAMVDVQTHSVFGGVRITFSELVSLRAGDFIPLSNSTRVTMKVGDRPLYVAEPVAANGMAAVRIVEKSQPR